MKFIQLSKLLDQKDVFLFFNKSIQHYNLAQSVDPFVNYIISGGFAEITNEQFEVFGKSVSLGLDSNDWINNSKLKEQPEYNYICFEKFDWSRNIIVVFPKSIETNQMKTYLELNPKFSNFQCSGSLTIVDGKIVNQSNNDINITERLFDEH